MPLFADIATLKRLARDRSKDELLADWEGFFLVCALSDEPPRNFITEPADPIPSHLQTPTRTRFEVQRLDKIRSHAFADRISLGRARNCDVVLLHPSISKLHAHFRSDGESMALIDLNSRNGTRVNGEVLVPERRISIASGDRIRFGRLETIFYDAGGLYAFLR